MFKTIVVATDGSDHARKAVELASDVAARYSSKLVLLHVLQPGPLPEGLRKMVEVEHLVQPMQSEKTEAVTGVPRWIRTVATSAESAEELRMAYAVGEHIVGKSERTARDKGVKEVHPIVEEGDPAKQILKCAEGENADLIVIGSRGLSDLKGLLMGSVSHKVTQLAKCTCVTVK